MKNYKILSVLLLVILIFGNNIFSQSDLSGTYYYHGNTETPIPDINVDLYDFNDVLIASTVTNMNGEYLFEGIADGEYYIEASTSISSGGVDLYDAFMVFYYIRGWLDFNEMEFEVGDVDDNGNVNIHDFVAILLEYLVGGQTFVGGDWEFENVVINLNAARSVDTVINIASWAASHGDVEGEWDPIGRDIDLMPSSYYNMEISDIGETTKLVVASDYKGYLNGFNLNLSYTTNEINIISISGPDGDFGYSVDDKNGIIKVAWINESRGTSEVEGDQLFVIEVTGITDIHTSGERVLYLLPGGMLIDSQNNKLNDTEIKLPFLLNEQKNDVVEVNVYPNPVVNKLNFNLHLNKQSYASLSIYDLSGKLVTYIENIALHEGEQSVSFNAGDLLPGNYVYSFDLKGENAMNVKGRFVKSK